MSTRRLRLALSALLAASLASPLVLAHAGHVGQAMEPGTPGGQTPCTGPGMMQGYGQGQGMGPGMMHGYGQGQGMGPGMMHGYGQGQGMGPGMMNGYGQGQGMGPGMMGPDMNPHVWALMNDAQREEARSLVEAFHRRQAERSGEMMTLRQRLMGPYQGGEQEADAMAEARARMTEMQQRMWQEHRELQRSLFGLLDEEQRQRLAPTR